MDDFAGLDDVYFADAPWSARLERWLAREEERRPGTFVADNAEVVARLFRDRRTLRMVVNAPAAGLLGFLYEGEYRNTYELRVGSEKPPDERRQRVDALVFGGEPPAAFYFGAVALGGTGVRFYGEYCLVLAASAVADDERIFDRNSWDVESPPLAAVGDRDELVARLRGTWSRDVEAMSRLKVLPHLVAAPRLATSGVVSDALLHDESFVEVHKRGTFGPRDLHEVRSSPLDAAVEGHVAERQRRGRVPTPEETVWIGHRIAVEERLAAHRIGHRIVTTTGRPGK